MKISWGGPVSVQVQRGNVCNAKRSRGLIRRLRLTIRIRGQINTGWVIVEIKIDQGVKMYPYIVLEFR